MDYTCKVYIIVLNWNGWEDTIECLNSIIRNDYKNYHIIICDNHSSDESVQKLVMWQEKNKKIKTTLLENDTNLGFAGGNNIGIRYAMGNNDFKYIWILNNDTIIKENALSKLLEKMESDNKIGICGSKLVYYDSRLKIQAIGGVYNKVTGIPRHIVQEKDICKLDYVVGASMLVSRKFLEEVGLMNEEYFLYYEELDWAMRSKGKFKLSCAFESIVYHKEGESTGGKERNRSEISDYYGIRSRILFTKRYFPKYLITVYFFLIGSVFNRMIRRQYRRIWMILKIVWENVF